VSKAKNELKLLEKEEIKNILIKDMAEIFENKL